MKKNRVMISSVIALSLAMNVSNALELRYDSATYMVNSTLSMPKGIYRITKEDTLKKGDYILFDPPIDFAILAHERGWFDKDWPLLKPIIAQEGDHFCNQEGSFRINNLYSGEVLTNDSQGRPIGHFEYCGVVPEGKIVVGVPKESRSLDSRYFGFVDKNEVQGVAELVWTY